MFWSVDDNYYNAEQILGTAAEKMTTLPPATSPDDRQLMHDAFRHL
jgi:hypothetical protein